MKRTPGMYAFYERNIKEAQANKNYELAEHLAQDAPSSVRLALIRNDVIEGSVEETRKGSYRVTVEYVYKVFEHFYYECTEAEAATEAERIAEEAGLPEFMNNEYFSYSDYEYDERTDNA